jgi:methionine synthase II (cobalamin-independent)
MQRSTERILTTHVGSLPRPPDLLEMINAKEEGRPRKFALDSSLEETVLSELRL